MNLNFIVNFLKSPKLWIVFNLIISLAIAITWISYEKHHENDRIEEAQKKLSKLQKEQLKVNKDLVRVLGLKKLPNISNQIEIVELYFESFGLDFEKQQVDKNGTYYNAVVSGSLSSLLLSLKDIKAEIIPLRYKNIAIADDNAALHIIILGSK
jgi:predicted negative regulator of RcsB-dependent stress response